MRPVVATSSPAPSRGFTLMEMLIVILIISALMGLLLPTIGMVKRNAAKAKATQQINQIAAAVNSFNTKNGSYPDRLSAGEMAKSDAADWERTNGKLLLIALNTVDPGTFRLLDANKSVTNDPNFVEPLRDPWGQLIRYRPARCYEFDTSHSDPSDARAEHPPMVDSFQVWSSGPDEIDAWGLGDDIANWKRVK